jgi:hypothetical protein
MKFFTFNNENSKLRAYAHKSGAFESKKTAFDYFFLFEGKSVEEAEKLAEIVTKARGVPEVPVVPPSGFDKVKSYIGQATELAKDNPKITDFLLGLLSGAVTSLGGVAVGSKLAQESTPPVQHEFNNIEPQEIQDADTV